MKLTEAEVKDAIIAILTGERLHASVILALQDLALAQIRADKQRHIAANAENMTAMHKAERDEARAECERLRHDRAALEGDQRWPITPTLRGCGSA